MAENVGGIYYDIGAKTQGLLTAQKQVSSSTRSVKRDFDIIGKSGDKLNSSLTRLAGVIAGVFAVGRIKANIQEQMNLMDSLAKTSDALRIQQERLQALQLVADLTGTGADQLAVNMERMQRNIGRVAREGGPAAKALDDIGVSIHDVIDLSPDKQLEALANAIGSVENAAVKASIAQDLFGRDGVRMLKLLEQLKNDGLDPVVAELTAMGVALSRVDTAKVEAANDSLTRAGLASTAIWQRLGVEVAPIVQGLAEMFVDASKESVGFANSAGEAIDFVVTAIGHVANGLRGWQILIKMIQKGWLEMARVAAQAMATVSGSLEDASDGTRLWGSTFLQTLANASASAQRAVFGTALSEQMDGAADSARIMESVLTDALTEIDAQINELATGELPSEKIDKFVAKWRAASEEAAKAVAEASTDQGAAFDFSLDDSELESQRQKVLEQARSIGLTRLQALEQQYADQRLLLVRAQAEGFESEVSYQERMNELYRQYSEDRKAIIDSEKSHIIKQLEAVGFSMDAMMNQGIGAIAGVVGGFQSGKDAIRSFAQSILTQAIGALIRMAVVAATGQTAAVATGAATASALGAAYATPAALASLASFGANAAPASAGIASTVALSNGLAMGGGRLNGGPVAPGSIYPVTEDGRPELLMQGGKQYLLPGSRGEVVSNKNMAQAGGSKTVVNVINQASGTKAEESRRQGPNNTEIVDIIVSDIQQRGKVHGAITNTTTAGNRI